MTSSIHLHIGGAGVQIGNSLWNQYYQEQENGTYQKYLFNETKNGYTPNTIFLDLDDSPTSQIKKEHIWLSNKNCFITGKESAAGNFARGYFTTGKHLTQECLTKLEQLAEKCDKLNEIIITSAISGGTGSGCSTYILEQLTTLFPKLMKTCFLIFPSEQISNNSMDIYNFILTSQGLINDSDALIIFDNQSMYDVIQNQMDIDCFGYDLVNSIISQTISSYTSVERFNYQNSKPVLNGIIPYKQNHLLIPTYGPFLDINDQLKKQSIENQVTKYIFNKNNSFYNCRNNSKFMISSLISRGIQQNYLQFQKSHIINQTQHTTYTFQVNASNIQTKQHLAQLKLTNTLFTNNASIHNSLNQIMKKYYKLYNKRSFVFWTCGEGLEERQYHECEYDWNQLIQSYKQLDET